MNTPMGRRLEEGLETLLGRRGNGKRRAATIQDLEELRDQIQALESEGRTRLYTGAELGAVELLDSIHTRVVTCGAERTNRDYLAVQVATVVSGGPVNIRFVQSGPGGAAITIPGSDVNLQTGAQSWFTRLAQQTVAGRMQVSFDARALSGTATLTKTTLAVFHDRRT